MDDQNRLENLHVQPQHIQVGQKYTLFVKAMRWGLPVVAVALIIVVIMWPKVEDKLVIVPKEELVPQKNNEIGENELLSPLFETIDSNGNPVKVTATRALQNQENPNLVKLKNPRADLNMKDSSKVNIEADNGTYEQETEKLFLQDNIKITHDSGYELLAEELRVDMKTRESYSDKNVEIDGPAAKIKAMGLEGHADDGILIFKGPATLTLKPKTNNQGQRTK